MPRATKSACGPSEPASESGVAGPVSESERGWGPASNESEDMAVVDGTLRAPWKWEDADRRILGDRRRRSLAAPARRPRAGVPGADRGAQRRGADSPRPALRARSRATSASAALRAADRRALAELPRAPRGATGSTRLDALAPRVLRHPSACSSFSRSCGRWRRSVRSRSPKSAKC